MSAVSGFRLAKTRPRLGAALLMMLSASDASAGDLLCPGDGTFAVANSGFAAYTIDGQNNPTLTVVRGCSYTFNVNAPGHPFWIKTVQGTGAGNGVASVVNNGTQVGSLTWTVPGDAPNTLFYNCQFHSPMTGTITVIDNPLLFVDGFE